MKAVGERLNGSSKALFGKPPATPAADAVAQATVASLPAAAFAPAPATVPVRKDPAAVAISIDARMDHVAKTRNLTGANHTSSLVEGTSQPNASYHWETMSSSKGVDKDIYYFALGSRFVLGKCELETDFLQDSRRNGPQAKGDVLSNTSYIGLARYKIPSIGSVHVK